MTKHNSTERGTPEAFEGKCLELSYKHDNEITLAIDDLWKIVEAEKKRAVVKERLRVNKKYLKLL